MHTVNTRLTSLKSRERRFIAACHAMQGLLSDPIDRADECLPGEPCHQAVARIAVAHADALIARLEEPAEKP